MGKTIRVEVTAEDIEAGVRRSAWRCPIAVACKRVADEPIIGRDSCNLTVDGVRFTEVELPTEAQAFIAELDSERGTPAPFAFDLELP